MDTRGQRWARVVRYLEPVFEAARDYALEDVRAVAADLYEICLGAELSCEVNVDPTWTLEFLERLLADGATRGEARARLVILKSLFAAAQELTSTSGIQCKPGSEAFVSGVLEEIWMTPSFSRPQRCVGGSA